ncbi:MULTISPECIES: RluA family pseudouridine synthase [unclassified Synechococcus]|uniref:RluA family pseudouridine synthase n=2 Tax=Synechococcus TaxID=1129 RepID=UPI001E290AE8|nr:MULTISPECIES: RluA family pseudouridine synthase [unclassified Synechococcus]CAK6689255.1 hypothetical protein IFHNHDMJ_00571 [Synechococcus sp. CBW1107]
MSSGAPPGEAAPLEEAPPPDWLPESLNQGHVYRERIRAADLRQLDTLSSPDSVAGVPTANPAGVLSYLASRFTHSGAALWRQRLAAGELWRNGHQLRADGPLAAGDRLDWHRPPWKEQAVPGSWNVLFDDGDLCVIDKPSGLPVLPAGGFSEHTLLRLLERRHGGDPAGVPRPVHRLGRSTSGLLVCARRPASRAWLSALLRDSSSSQRSGTGQHGQRSCSKIYRALTTPLPPDLAGLAPGESLTITTPIGRRPHPLLGTIWCAAETAEDPAALAAESRLTLLQRRCGACLVAVAITTGRPHQIRIHTAALGAPLLGDPLYQPGGTAHPAVLPGAGGYHLHAHRLSLPLPGGGCLELESPLPAVLAYATEPMTAGDSLRKAESQSFASVPG